MSAPKHHIPHLCSLYSSSWPSRSVLQSVSPHRHNLRRTKSRCVKSSCYEISSGIWRREKALNNTPVLSPFSFLPILMAAGFSGVMNSLICCYWGHRKHHVSCSEIKLEGCFKVDLFRAPCDTGSSSSLTSFTLNGAPLSFTVKSVTGSICSTQTCKLL